MDHVAVTALRIVAIAMAFGLTVFVHEAGHFVSARLLGMAVHEFSIGFGRPLLFWFRRGETQYSFRLWPFLSYVHIAGMEPGDDHPQGFDKRSRLAQATVLVTGCMMNFLLAVAIYVVMGAAIGFPVPASSIGSVLPNSPAARAGLMPGDRVVGLDSRTGLSVDDIREQIQSHPGRPLVLRIERKGKVLRITITPSKESGYDIKGLRLIRAPIGRIGIIFDSTIEPMGIGRSVVRGFALTYEMIRLQIVGLVGMATRTVPPDVMGPVGVVDVLYKEAAAGTLAFLNVAAMLTVGVGFINLMPIPPLDGSKLFIVGLEAIRRKSFDEQKKNAIALVGFALLMVLVAVLTYKDILRIVR